jgi:cell division septum initiation protein DivIVA
MENGKPVIPYGRKAVVATKLDLEEILMEIIDLKDRVAKLEKEAPQDDDTEDKPRRGRRPKEATE